MSDKMSKAVIVTDAATIFEAIRSCGMALHPDDHKRIVEVFEDRVPNERGGEAATACER